MRHMPINIPNPQAYANVGSTNTSYPPLPYGVVPNPNAPSQQGFGLVTTLINPFFTNISFPVTNSVGQFLYWGTTTPVTSSIGVSDYNNHAFSAYIYSSASTAPNTSSIFVSSSVDGLNWVGEFSFSTLVSASISTTSSIIRLTGRRGYFIATYSGSGNTTASLYLISGQ